MLQALITLLFASRCPLCRGPLSGGRRLRFCAACEEKIEPVRGPCCPTCGRPFPAPDLSRDTPGFRCGECRLRPPSLDGAVILARFQGPLRQGIHAFKYSGQWCLGRDLLRCLAGGLPERLAGAEAVLPVPLHARRLRQRGFNQSAVLAREISKITGLPHLPDLLARPRRLSPQVGLRGRERLANVRGAFRVTHPEAVRGRELLLVDDVVTTGATANECARMLKKAGAAGVGLLALAGVTPGDPSGNPGRAEKKPACRDAGGPEHSTKNIQLISYFLIGGRDWGEYLSRSPGVIS